MSDHDGAPFRRYLVFFAIAVFGCAADLATKHWVFQWRGWPKSGNEWWIWKGYVGIETAMNPGALFGMASGMGLLLAVLSIAAALGILFWMFYWKAAQDWLLTVALGCVMAGILGNLYDRLGLAYEPGMPEKWERAVRDWILLRYDAYTWPNFNIADSLLVCGAAMLAWHAFRHSEDQHSETACEANEPSASAGAGVRKQRHSQ